MPTEKLQKELDALHARNLRVEADKAWELSRTRRVFIATVTYCTAGVWLLTISDTHPWLKALVPTAGYLLSTLSLPPLKRWWTDRQK